MRCEICGRWFTGFNKFYKSHGDLNVFKKGKLAYKLKVCSRDCVMDYHSLNDVNVAK